MSAQPDCRRRFTLAWLVLIVAGIAACGGGGGDGSRGSLVSVRPAGALSRDQVDSILAVSAAGLAPASHGVTLYRVVYDTRDRGGRAVEASGMLAVPDPVDGPLPVVSYQHGTETLRSSVPSNPSYDEGLLAWAAFAGAGYAVVTPDYLGLGSSPGIHPFVDTVAEGVACLDMLRAASTASTSLHLSLSVLFLAGYSEGGHATLALEQAIETEGSATLPLRAVGPGAGPYDLSSITMPHLLHRPEPPSSLLIAYFLVSHRAQDRLFGSFSEAFVSPFDVEAAALFDGTHDTDEISATLPADPVAMLQPDYLAAVTSDPAHPVNVALRANDLVDFVPKAPVRLFHSKADTLVPFENSSEAASRMAARGADAAVVALPGGLDHGDAIVPYVEAARQLFDSLR